MVHGDQDTESTLVEPFTPRELEILGYLDGPLTQREIARELNLALSTTKWYIHQIYQKLGLRSRSQAVRRALELGVLVGSGTGKGTTSHIPHNLPAPVTGFIGRQNELSRVRELLAKGRLITLTGTGGVGKTRLGLQVADVLIHEAQRTDALEGGVWFVDLAPIAEPNQICQAVASSLLIKEKPGEMVEDGLITFFRDRPALLILDNCEHLVDSCVLLLDSLLRSCQKLKVMVTSREPMAITGESIYLVPPMVYPAQGTVPSLDEFMRYEAVQLFAERAAAIQPGFHIGEANAPAVARICQRMDGIPLAIELAAVKLRMLSVGQIADLLDDRFKLLTSGSRSALPRHQTLEALVTWSHNLLTEPEKIVFRRLAIFAGGWDMEAVPPVCEDEVILETSMLDILGRLVDKSLIIKTDLDDSARYNMLETIHQYARLKLFESGESRDIRERHWSWCVDLVENAALRLRGSQQVTWVTRLDREYANLRVGLERALRERDVVTGMRITGGLAYYWVIRGSIREGIQLLEGVVDQVEKRLDWEPDRWYGRCLLGLGWLHLEARDLVAAQPILERALDQLRKLGDQDGVGLALYLLSATHFYRQDRMVLPESRAMIEEALKIMQALDDPWGIGICLDHLAHVLDSLGEFDIAYEKVAHGVDYLRQAGDLRALSNALNVLAWQTWNRGDTNRTSLYFEEALEAYRAIGSQLGEASVLVGCSIWACWSGDYERARLLLGKSLDIYRQFKDRHNIANGVYQLGQIALWQADLDRAKIYLEESCSLYEALGDQAWVGWMQSHLGYVHLLQGELSRAGSLLMAGLDALEEAKMDIGQHLFGLFGRYIYRYLGEYHLVNGNHEQAGDWFRKGLTLIRQVRCQPHVPEYLDSLAKLAAYRGNYPDAVHLFSSAEALRHRFGIVPQPVEQPSCQYNLNVAQDVLGNAFQDAWEEGEQMTLDQMVDFALEGLN